MSTKEIRISDLSGEPDAVATHIAFDGDLYEVDLTDDEREEVAHLVGVYLNAGRRIGPVQVAGTKQKQREVPETTYDEREEIKRWARKNGFDIAERGRIPKNVMKAWYAAQGKGYPDLQSRATG